MEPKGGPRLSGLSFACTVVPLFIAGCAMIVSYAVGDPGLCWDIAWTGGAIGALSGALVARRRAVAANRGRWTLWALAAACWLFGQLGWDVFGLVGFPPSPNLADAGWWAFAALVALSMLRMPGSRAAGSDSPAWCR